MSNLNDLANEIHQLAKEKGWWEPPKTVGEVLMLIVSEVAEALEEYRAGITPTEVYYREPMKPEGIAIELADVIIRVLDYCAYAGIDIDAAMKLKHEYNKTRSQRHGGKLL